MASEMMKFYASFGQEHAHRINNQTYDLDSLLLVGAPDVISARLAIHELTGGHWCGTYTEEELPGVLHYFPRGILNADNPIIAELRTL